MHMPFGKYKWTDLRSIPSDYLLWLLNAASAVDHYPGLRRAAQEELASRNREPPRREKRTDPPPRQSVPVTLVAQVRRELALKHHPDRGGNKDVMAGINIALDRIEELI